jgi:hypothetical protein
MQQKITFYELSSELFVLFHRNGRCTALRLVNYPSTVYYQISTLYSESGVSEDNSDEE